MILPETDAEGALQYANKMRRAVEDARFCEDGVFKLTISAGCASSGVDASSPKALMAVSDRRLYMAKANGRNCVCAEG